MMRLPIHIISLLVVFVVVAAGCKAPATMTTATRHKETGLHTVYRVDSIYIDRWHMLYERGDTVYRTDSVFRNRYVSVHDTIHDTTYIDSTRTITQWRDKPLTGWQKFINATGYAALGTVASLIIAFIVFCFIKIK